MKKRLFGILLSIAMILSAIPGVSAASDYLWLEAEDASASDEFETAENPEASGGKLLMIDAWNAPDGQSYKISFDFSADAGNYDIWFLSGSGNSNALSKFKWSLNGSTPAQYASTGEENPAVYEQELSYIDYKLQWNRAAKGAQLIKGANTVDFIIDSKELNGSYLNLLDALVVVPSVWQWQPDADIVRPEPVPARFAWIELEAPDSQTRLESVASSSASGGRMLYAYNLRPADNDEEVERLYYSFEVESGESYDIWYLGCASDNASAHLSGLYWDVDAEPEVSASYRNENPQGTSLTILNSAGATSEIPLYWQKLGTEELSAGEHRLYLTYAYRNLSGNPRAFMLWGDCAMIVPSSWNWTPPAEGDENILPDYTAGYLAGKYLAEKNFTGDYSALTSDLILPDSLKNPVSAQIGFESERPDVMDNEGRVTRPLFSSENAVFNFNICAEKNGRRSYYPIPITVLKLNKYDISPISVTDGGGDEVSGLSAGAELTASVNIKINTDEASGMTGNGMLLMLLYNREGALMASSMAKSQISNSPALLSTGMTLPDDVSGAQLRVYLLNGLEMGNRLAEGVVMDG